MDQPIGKKRGGSYFRRGKRRYNNEPITSYGLILFHKLPSGEFRFLLQQRRDTFEYMDFIRGMWRTDGQLMAFFSLMSVKERRRIREFTFQELWDDLFVERSSKMYREMYPKAKKKYENIRHLIPNILDTTQTYVDDPPWGFPKGKKNYYREPETECAIRETEEETRINRSEIQVFPIEYSEKFLGTNGKTYATHYFLGEVATHVHPHKMSTPGCIRKDTISEEAQEIMWVSFSEACKYLNPRRQLMLREALQSVEKYSRQKK